MTAKHVSQTYRHHPKRISPGEAVDLGNSCLKWYDLAKAETPVDPDVSALAHRFLARGHERKDWPLDEDVGFVILHRCGAEFYFLILCTWRGDNELWETVYFKPDGAALDFAPFPQAAHKGTFCVWEAGIVAHEMSAWSRYLRSAHDDQALQVYLRDSVSGAVE
jgi:hypothetical protein